MRIFVTKEDLRPLSAKEKKYYSRRCPIAKSLKRRGFRNVSVAGGYVSIGKKKVDLPAVASDFVRAFDGGRLVSPFSFSIDV